jgi:glutamyl-tRNA synthetase
MLHIGAARTALFNWLWARRNGGQLVLRIEDTDRTRHVEEALEVILESMKWLGLGYDEGPYYQSERLDLYKQKAEELLARDQAYYDTDAEGRKAVRYRVPEGQTAYEDLVFGRLELAHKDIEDFVILKSDGFPTYNFGCVIDDADMGITHVIRGNDHLTNTPKQILLYKALGLEPPQFAHMCLTLGPDGAKLSKRHGAVAVTSYREMGFLPEALRNFIALLGWSPGEDREIVTLEETIELFDPKDLNRNPSQFDMEKALWMNQQYIMKAETGELVEPARAALAAAGHPEEKLTDDFVAGLVSLYRERMKTFKELAESAGYFFEAPTEYEPKAFKKFLGYEGAPELLEGIVEVIEAAPEFTAEAIEPKMRELVEQRGVGFGKLAQAIRVAVTGTKVSPPIFETIELLGRKETLERLRRALEASRAAGE